MQHLNYVIERFTAQAHNQEAKGLEKYGKALDPFDRKNYDWLEMAEEELVDAFKYFHAEKVRRDTILDTVIRDLEGISDDLKEKRANDVVIHSQLDICIYRLRKLYRNPKAGE